MRTLFAFPDGTIMEASSYDTWMVEEGVNTDTVDNLSQATLTTPPTAQLLSRVQNGSVVWRRGDG